MKNDNPDEREAVDGLLWSARKHYENLRRALEVLVDNLNVDGEIPKSKDVKSEIAEFRKSLNTVIEIESNLAKRSHQQRDAAGACALDLAAARHEVIERLARRIVT